MFFYAVDADEIGKSLEALLLNNKEKEVAKFSKDVSESINLVKMYLEKKGAEIIFCGGDNLLAKSNENLQLNIPLPSLANITWSVGIGNSIEKASLALKKAKGMGRNRIEFL